LWGPGITTSTPRAGAIASGAAAEKPNTSATDTPSSSMTDSQKELPSRLRPHSQFETCAWLDPINAAKEDSVSAPDATRGRTNAASNLDN
jgi:hypothetical protein